MTLVDRGETGEKLHDGQDAPLLARELSIMLLDERARLNSISDRVIHAAVRVHQALGPGILESAYESCLILELLELGLHVERQKLLPLEYRDHRLDCAYRIDLVAEREVIIEVKAIERLERVHSAQLLAYLRLMKLKLGLLINFNVPWLQSGIKRIVNGFPE